MTEKLDSGDSNARKGYIRSIVDAIEVDDKAIRIIGSKDVLQAVIAGKQTRTEMFVVLYANGAPEEIRTPALRFVLKILSGDFLFDINPQSPPFG
jgi:hypothetical protein